MPDINYALVAKPHPKRHVVHRYWARKPHNVVSKYIETYSNKGDVVLDPFCGSGVTFCEAIRLDRRAIAIDLNPIACFITHNVTKPFDTDKIAKEFEAITKDVAPFILQKYSTTCRDCGKPANILATIFDNGIPIKIVYRCENCNKRKMGDPNEDDIKLIKSIKHNKIIGCLYIA
jgi:hypothetical protein